MKPLYLIINERNIQEELESLGIDRKSGKLSSVVAAIEQIKATQDYVNIDVNGAVDIPTCQIGTGIVLCGAYEDSIRRVADVLEGHVPYRVQENAVLSSYDIVNTFHTGMPRPNNGYLPTGMF